MSGNITPAEAAELRPEPRPDYGIDEPFPSDVQPIPPPEPLPVYMVDAGTKNERVRWAPRTVPVVANKSVQVAGERLSRKTLDIRNVDAANSVFLSPDADFTANNLAYELEAEQSVSFSHTDPVHARCAGVLTAKLVVSEEYALQDD